MTLREFFEIIHTSVVITASIFLPFYGAAFVHYLVVAR